MYLACQARTFCVQRELGEGSVSEKRPNVIAPGREFVEQRRHGGGSATRGCGLGFQRWPSDGWCGRKGGGIGCGYGGNLNGTERL